MIVITSGDPAGIGPDITVKIASESGLGALVIGDADLLKQRAEQMGLNVNIRDYKGGDLYEAPGVLHVLHTHVMQHVNAGVPDPRNASYVLNQIDIAVAGCLAKQFSAMVTAPVSKSVICDAGLSFSGHTGYIAEETNTKDVVMMLACEKMRIALVTTHLPLSQVSSAITRERICKTVNTVSQSLQQQFNIDQPSIYVAGLNPHAGEGGYLGREEIEVITPALSFLNHPNIHGPLPADTMFSHENCQNADCFIAMYHDQGLSVLKYAGFGQAANITLGLPIIRTSVDHGTAFDLAGGKGTIDTGSLVYAIEQAHLMARAQKNPH